MSVYIIINDNNNNDDQDQKKTWDHSDHSTVKIS